MKAKRIIIGGILISALLTTLVLFNWLPSLVSAFLVLGLTLTASFFIALSSLRGQSLGNEQLLVTAIQRIKEQAQERQIYEQLVHWAKTLVVCQSSFYLALDRPDCQPNGVDPEEWKTLSLFLTEQGQSLISPPAKTAALPSGINSLLAVPLKLDGQTVTGILYLLNRIDSEEFLPADQRLVEKLVSSGQAMVAGLRSQTEQEEYYLDIIKALIRCIESKQIGFFGHAQRVSSLAERLASVLGFNHQEIRSIRLAALLHDAGKMAPYQNNLDSVRPGEEAGPEIGAGDQHPVLGAELLPAGPRYKWLREAILYHHERYNGSGFPQGLRHNEIPLPASVIAVADVFDALTHLNCEEERLSYAQALGVIKKTTGTLFDPMVVVALEELAPELMGGDNPL